MQINNNVMAFNAYRNLNTTQGAMAKSLEKLSSGFRINRAADDASGLTISEGLRSEVRGSQQAIRNAQDGISFVQTAEGALDEVHGMLQRMRELAVQAENSTSGGEAEKAEMEELVAEIKEIGTRTEFSGTSVFADFSSEAFTLQVGANEGNTIDIELDLRVTVDADAEAGGTTASPVPAEGFLGVNLEGLDLSADAGAAITAIGSAIDNVSSTRSELGATQNRLESAVRNLQVGVENLSAAESRIRDTDMAQEMVQFTRHQILQQAGTSMLAQANMVPQSVLGLLG